MTTSENAPIILVDGSSYLYRAFHAMPPLTSSKGQPTGAVRGVVNMLRRMQDDYPQSNIVVIFDAKGKTFRDEMYSEYKANRPPMPDELRAQIAPLHACVLALGFPMIVHPGVEADDVMGTLAVEGAAKGMDVIISTGDKDMAQLVNERITLVNTMSNTVYDRAGVIEKFGVPPELIIDYLAIIGDSSDNIPGVPGVGPKSAAPMLNGIGSLKDIYDNLEDIRTLEFRGAKKMPERLAEHKEQAFLSYDLATIKIDVELEQKIEALVNREPEKEQLLELFTELEFKSWIKELESGASVNKAAKPTTAATAATKAKATDITRGSAVGAPSDAIISEAPKETNYHCILDKAEFDAWVERLKSAPVYAFDTETTSLNYMDAEIVGISFAIEAGEAAYVPVAHDYLDAPVQLDRDYVLAQLKPILEDTGKSVIAQNLKYDQSVLANYDIKVHNRVLDTMLESYVYNSVGGRHDMDSLAKRRLDRETIRFEDVAGKGAKQLTFNQVALEQAAPYAAEDADITLQLHHSFWKDLESERSLIDLYNEIEAPLIKVLSSIERNGVVIDPDAMFEQSEEIGAKVQQLETQVHDLAGQVFNLGSPKQLQEILYDKLELPILKKTPKGQPSTAEEVLQQLAEQYDIPRLILEYRSLTKLKSTYTDKLPLMINKKTGRIHTSYHQAVTATGRLSSTDPNLQNIPVRTEEGRRIRKAFIAPEGTKMVAADYSQIELRIMAHLSQDEGLLKAFKEGKDVHRATAAEVFGVAIDEVDSEQRRKAKAINFGLIYGMSAFGLAKQLQIGRGEAQQYMDLYFERYPGVKRFMDEIRTQASETGYVETLLGRRLYLPDINNSNGNRRQAAERTAINAPMQGTAADIIKKAMINVHAWLASSEFDAKMIMQVHDELVFEIAEDQVDAFVEQVKQKMQNAANLDVPLIVDAGIGDNWEEAH